MRNETTCGHSLLATGYSLLTARLGKCLSGCSGDDLAPTGRSLHPIPPVLVSVSAAAWRIVTRECHAAPRMSTRVRGDAASDHSANADNRESETICTFIRCG